MFARVSIGRLLVWRHGIEDAISTLPSLIGVSVAGNPGGLPGHVDVACMLTGDSAVLGASRDIMALYVILTHLAVSAFCSSPLFSITTCS